MVLTICVPRADGWARGVLHADDARLAHVSQQSRSYRTRALELVRSQPELLRGGGANVGRKGSACFGNGVC
jgi:ferric-dicitrate binding protein FerR (iron transport regulator)